MNSLEIKEPSVTEYQEDKISKAKHKAVKYIKIGSATLCVMSMCPNVYASDVYVATVADTDNHSFAIDRTEFSQLFSLDDSSSKPELKISQTPILIEKAFDSTFCNESYNAEQIAAVKKLVTDAFRNVEVKNVMVTHRSGSESLRIMMLLKENLSISVMMAFDDDEPEIVPFNLWNGRELLLADTAKLTTVARYISSL